MTGAQPMPTTTDSGAPVASDEHSLTIGPDGPILLQDVYLIEQMAQFNRERVPERQPRGDQPARQRHAVGLLDAVPGVSPPGHLADGRPGHSEDLAAHERLLQPHYMWVNAQRERFWVKYHFKTDQGIEFLTQAEGDHLAGADGDYHTRDLYEAIERGEYPSWTLTMQIMPFADAKTYRFNPFDLTKVWPHGDYPLIEVRRMTLDRNPTDYHTEIEQAAFGCSPTRTPTATGSVRTTSSCRCTRRTPTAVRRPPASGTTSRRCGTPTGTWCVPPTRCARRTTTGASRAPCREVLDDAARTRLVSNIVGHLLNGVSEPILQRAFEYWRNVDKDLGDRVEQGVRAGQS